MVVLQASLEGGHHRLVALHDLGVGDEDRLTDVVFVDLDRRAVGEGLGLAEQTLEARADLGGAVEGVARVALLRLEEQLANLDRRLPDSHVLVGAIVVALLVEHHDLRQHVRVRLTAVLGAEDLVLARLGRGEPERGVAAGEHVLLHAKIGDVEGVDDVLRLHDELHRAVDRHAELVEDVAALVLELPRPLAAADLDLLGVRGGDAGGDVVLHAPVEEADAGDERAHGPEDLERDGVHRRLRELALVPGLAAVLVDPVTRGPADEDEHDDAHPHEEVEETVDTRRERRLRRREPER